MRKSNSGPSAAGFVCILQDYATQQSGCLTLNGLIEGIVVPTFPFATDLLVCTLGWSSVTRIPLSLILMSDSSPDPAKSSPKTFLSRTLLSDEYEVESPGFQRLFIKLGHVVLPYPGRYILEAHWFNRLLGRCPFVVSGIGVRG